MKILFLVPYPSKVSPSQRFRFEQYFSCLEKNGYQLTVQSFLDSRNWQEFYKTGRIGQKLFMLAKGFLKRLLILSRLSAYDFVFVHREASPIGPPVFEWIAANVMNRKIIYDFDDAIWLTDRANESIYLRFGKYRSKVASICSWAYKVSCGNRYLYDFASAFNPRVVLNPTTIDVDNVHVPVSVKKKKKEIVTIGWTGTHSTLKYFALLEPVLQKIEAQYPFVEILVVANEPPTIKLKSLRYLPWNSSTEIEDLSGFDIGLMPLPDDEWAKGKCGLKILQYMALEIPAVASPVGVNTQLINDGVNGFLCASSQEWHVALEKLIESRQLREEMGINGREFVKVNYSTTSNSSTVLSLFQ